MMTGERRPAESATAPRWATPAAMAALDCDKPVIAAVDGPSVGWGMELALFADIRIASERASFAELFIKRGLVARCRRPVAPAGHCRSPAGRRTIVQGRYER